MAATQSTTDNQADSRAKGLPFGYNKVLEKLYGGRRPSLAESLRAQNYAGRLHRNLPPSLVRGLNLAGSQSGMARYVNSAKIGQISRASAEGLASQAVSAPISADRRRYDGPLKTWTAQSQLMDQQRQTEEFLASYLAAYPVPAVAERVLEQQDLSRIELGETDDAMAAARKALELRAEEMSLTAEEQAQSKQFLTQTNDNIPWWSDGDRDYTAGGKSYGTWGTDKDAAWDAWSKSYPDPYISFGSDQTYKSSDVFDAVYQAKTDFAKDPEKAATAAAIGIVASGEKPTGYERATQRFATETLKTSGLDTGSQKATYQKVLEINCLTQQRDGAATKACFGNLSNDLKDGMTVLDKVKGEGMLDKANPGAQQGATAEQKHDGQQQAAPRPDAKPRGPEV